MTLSVILGFEEPPRNAGDDDESRLDLILILDILFEEPPRNAGDDD